MSYSPEVLDRCLSAVEQRELRSLQWGFVEGSLATEELHELLSQAMGPDEPTASPADLAEALIERGLLFEQRQPNGTYGYRSRFAEGVRLLTTIRQVFPDRPWQSAPPLVSDYRINARPRSFPRRDLPVAQALAALKKTPRWLQEYEASAHALVTAEHRFAAFQVRAMELIFQKADHDTGVVVCAGTGSGKTLSFYMPAMMEVGALVRPNEHWVKVVALYPRIELLKDQFSEAYRSARKIDQVQKQRGLRPVRLGALFSLTPPSATVSALEMVGWAEAGRDFVCPFMTCPECGDELVWRRQDLEQGKERLVCKRGARCQGTVTPDQVVLTRKELLNRPPDFLFTTTEILNQRMADTEYRPLFGVGTQAHRRLRLVLLDEVHTYTGPTGAQTALVLRRWRHALATPVRFVGLSATLREAPQFFAELVGTSPDRVTETAPDETEMDHRSMVYELVLRSNPASQAALLSTSIQASFLLARLLDPLSASAGRSSRSGNFFGSRLFVFTDDLDVTNRLYDDLKHAEAYKMWGDPDPRRQPLAALRSGARPDPAERDRLGQNWRTLEELGHTLDSRLRITRTSSQDKGVSQASNVIVATAALEVGFNDPTVGAVLQHKSPHDMAAYLQRKGRAGRLQVMRPWMVTVLSEYGRDRLTFQAYDQLFEPVLLPQRLPVKNRHILRMQAVLALLDWLAVSIQAAGGRGWAWRILNGAAESGSFAEQQQQQVLGLLTDLLEDDGSTLRSLSDYLRKALQLDQEDELSALLWEAPRSIMLEVVPTIVRRLKAKWRVHPAIRSGAATDIVALGGRVHPLPDYVPASLFSPLNVPEVSVRIPPASRNHKERVETMGIVQALRQLVPGRISRRFAFERSGLHHWVPVPLVAGEYLLPISRYAEQHELVATVQAEVEGRVQPLPVFRPWTVVLEQVSEKEVKPTSNAVLDWSFDIEAPPEATTVTTGQDPRWGSVVLEAAFHLHTFRTPVLVRRFAHRAMATLRRPTTPEEIRVTTRFTTDEGDPAAVGFEQTVDGLRLRAQLPGRDRLADLVAQSANGRSWLTAYFRDLVLNDETLAEEANWFQRDWVHQIFFSALLAKAAASGCDLADALPQLLGEDRNTAFVSVMDAVFGIDAVTESEDEPDVAPEEGEENRRLTLRERLLAVLNNPVVLDRLQSLAVVLWAPDQDAYLSWLAGRMSESIAEAVLQGCQRIAPKYVAPDSLLVDVVPVAGRTLADGIQIDVWVTEADLGGAGAIEAIAEEVIADPRKLFRALDAALAPSDLAVVAAGLDSFVSLTQTDPAIAELTRTLREQERHTEHQHQFRRLMGLLARKGLTVDASISVALHQRILRKGSSEASDGLIADLLGYWAKLESELGVAIDQRVFCYLAVVHPSYGVRIRELVRLNAGADLSVDECVSTLAGILWPQPAEQRRRSLESYSPFRMQGWTDPTVVRDILLSGGIASIDFAEPTWKIDLHQALAGAGTARLFCTRNHEERLHRQLYELLAEPVDMDYLQFFVAIDQVQRDEQQTSITFAVKEIV